MNNETMNCSQCPVKGSHSLSRLKLKDQLFFVDEMYFYDFCLQYIRLFDLFVISLVLK